VPETPPPPTEELKESGASAPSTGPSSRSGMGGASRPGTGDVGSRSPPTLGLGGDPFVGVGVDRVARIQTLAAVVLGLALIAIPLYLWRRPRSESIPVTSALNAGAPLSDAGLAAVAAPLPSSAPALPQVTLSEAKVMECHDTGSRRTRPEDCDHLAAVEKGFAAAVTAGGSCLPPGTGGGTLVYVLDASFGRKHRPFELLIPRDGRSLKSGHGAAGAVSACGAAVKKGLDELSLEGLPHAHARYKIAITATYVAPTGSVP
jgi:hypothetical protein